MLGVTEEAGRPVIDALVEHVRDGGCCSSSTTASTWCTRAPTLAQAAAAGGPAPQGARDEPRAAARRRRDDLPGARARAFPRPHKRDHAGGAAAIRGGAPVRRPRRARCSRHSRSTAQNASAVADDLPPRSTAFRWRSSSPPRACARCRSTDRRAPGRSLSPADRRRPHRSAAPADAARVDRLELRPSDGRRARAVPHGSPCSPADLRSKPPKRSGAGAGVDEPESSIS